MMIGLDYFLWLENLKSGITIHTYRVSAKEPNICQIPKEYKEERHEVSNIASIMLKKRDLSKKD